MLQTPLDLFAWLHEAGLWEAAQKKRAEEWASASDEGATAQLLQTARTFRGILRSMAETLSKTGAMPKGEVLDAINGFLKSGAGYEQIARQQGADGFVSEFVPQSALSVPDEAMATLAQTARDLLCFADLSLVKHCEGPGCILLFLDTTKNHTRCWCSMAGCGNRAKAAAHYQRVRAAKKA